MRILFAVHIGETLGHLVRALSLADEFTKLGARVDIAASDSASTLLQSWPHAYKHHPLNWGWSHNECGVHTPSSTYINRICASVSSLRAVILEANPNLIVGCPGFASFQVARHLGIPHVSILHGPYLAPIVHLDNLVPHEARILEFSRSLCRGSATTILSAISDTCRFPEITYEQYLKTEDIYVPQPGLNLPPWPNLTQTQFIRASFGPPIDLDDEHLSRACYVTFGSGNPCDISSIVDMVSAQFRFVVVSTGHLQLSQKPRNVLARPFVASASLAGRVGAVISHGGIGTVGTFAEHGTPQLIIPTELDQATMAMHAVRLGIAEEYGLRSWINRETLGRRLPEISRADFVKKVSVLQDRYRKVDCPKCSGGAQIARSITERFASELKA